MRANYIQFNSPQFRLLSTKQIDELHCASIRILENTGVAVHSEEAISLLADAGIDVSNPRRVKIKAYIVEQALKKVPKHLALYTREGKPYVYLNGLQSYFGAVTDTPDYLDPYTSERRHMFIEDITAVVRLIDALPNYVWFFNSGMPHGFKPDLGQKVTTLHSITNTSKIVMSSPTDVSNLKSMLELCFIISGGSKEFKARPFYINSVEPVTPLVLGKDALEMSLLCAELGVPNMMFSMLMSGSTSPATFAGTLAVANAELLSLLTIVQLKKPGAPVVYGAEPNVMDMRTAIFPYGAPELCLLTACFTELAHYYGLPMFGTAGTTDAKVIGTQAGVELMRQCLMSAFSGADLIHNSGIMDHCTMLSPELIVLMDEIIDQVRVLMAGIEINEETLALDLIDKVGPGGHYLAEEHTFKHFRKHWVPKIMDRTTHLTPGDNINFVKHCEDLLKQRTIGILENHKPSPLGEDKLREIKKLEQSWFKELGLEHSYPKGSKLKKNFI